MKCEICRTIERLGLDPSTHEMWFCRDRQPAVSAISLSSRVEHFTVMAASFPRIAADFLIAQLREAMAAGIENLPASREHYIKLGL